MKEKRNTVFWEGWCSVEIPEDWTWSQDDNLVSIFNESEGVGVLQISFARRLQADNPTKEEVVRLALSFTENQGWKVDIRMIRVTRLGQSFISRMDYSTGGEESTHWRVWHVVEDTRVACVTYNSAEEDKDIEADAIDAIVDSLRWR